MHIGAWQEYKLYKILLMRENYMKNGLYQLSTQSKEERVRRKAVSVKSHPSVASNSEKTTEIGYSQSESIESGKDRTAKSKKRGKSLTKKSEVVKSNYRQWMNYEKAKDRAQKAFLKSFEPPKLPPLPRAKRPIVKKPENIHKARIKKMKAVYGITKEEEKKVVTILPSVTVKADLEELKEEEIKQSVDEGDVDKLLEWAQNLPEELSSSARKAS
eukprot:TRINITY_DN12033_c0_g4_i1.p1 TRINITY_DN12033_c0_g4~~TRINITY_DN12033_c0_g4_i1.p1  ORF type:complete len:215 (+),score=63.42 TRINITY_DN12033_c0_g4_i1:177-821(+)